jgi:hypothetical protein
MINQDSELEAFKREIDLRQFAVSPGYEIDRRESWRGSTVLRRGAGKVVVRRSGNGHYVFFSVRDDGDHGTLIDFLQRRQNLSLGAVRQILRPWLGRPSAPAQFPKLEPASPDRMRVESAYRRMLNAPRFPYLESERRVPAAVLLSQRFAGRMRIDSLGNTVFPHFDAAGLCGYEVKNRGFTGFAAGGQKGLWLSHAQPHDRRLVLAESAMDALSYAALFPDAEDQTRYASLGRQTKLAADGLGPCDPRQAAGGRRDRGGVRHRPGGAQVGGCDSRGVASVASRTKRSDLIFKAHLAVKEGEDWNLVLKNGGMHPASQVRR